MPIQNTGSDIRLRGNTGDGVTDINEEINGNSTDTNVSLGTLNTTAFTNVSDGSVITGRAMSEMQGYSTFTSSLPQTEAEGALGESLLFDGSNIQYASFTPSLTGNRRTWTMSFWVKINKNDTQETIISQGSTSIGNVFVIRRESNNKFAIYIERSGGYSKATANSLIIDNSGWYNVVIAFDVTKTYSGDKVRIYINGIEEKDITYINSGGLFNDTDWAFNVASSAIRIGQYRYTNSDYLDGTIADFKFIDGQQLRPDSFGELVQGIWIPKAFNTPSTDQPVTNGLIANYELNGNVNDTSGSATTYNGTSSNVTFLKNNYGIASFNGSNSKIDLPSNPISTNLVGSVSLWAQGSSLTNTSTNVHMILYNRNPYISFNTYNGNLQVTVKNSSSSNTTINYATSNFNATDWYHISYVVSGTSSNFKLFVNGLSVGTATAPSTTFNVASTGYLGHGGNYQYFNGKIGEVQVYSSTLTSAQILQNYNATKHKYAFGLNGFHLPFSNISTGSIVNDSSLKLHLDASNNSSYGGSGTTWSDLSGNGNNATLYGSPNYLSANEGYFNFDGADDYAGSSYVPSTRYVTGECWINVDSSAGNGTDTIMYLQGNSSGTQKRIDVAIYGTGSNSVSSSSNLLLISNTNWLSGWWHVAVDIDFQTGLCKVYLNGTYFGQTTATPYSPVPSGISFGKSGGNYYGDFQAAQFRVYEKSLTAQEVITNYRATQGNYEQVNTVDISGSGNNFTSTNIDATDHTKDEPLDNYATFDPNLENTGGSLSEGNLKVVSTADTFIANKSFSSGKWYAEFTMNSASNAYIAVFGTDFINPNMGGGWGSNGAIAYRQNGTQYSLAKGGSSAVTSYGASYASGNIIGVEVDVAGDTIEFYKNGVSQGQTTNGLSYIGASQYSFTVYGGTSTITANFGQKPWAYTPSTGFLALSTKNLAAPTFDPDGATPDKPSNYFKAVTYQGNGSTQGEDYGFKEGSKAAVFNGSNGYISLPGVMNNITNTFSYSGWFKVNSSTTDHFIAFFASTSPPTFTNTNAVNFTPVHSSGNYYFDFGNLNIAGQRLTGTAPEAWKTGWHHLVVSKSSTTITVYVDGEQFRTGSSSGSVSITSAARLGNYTGNYANGFMDDVRLYSDALTATEVGYLYNDDTTNIDAISNLVAYYDMEGDANEANSPSGSIDSGQSAVFNGSSNIIKSTGLGVAYRNQTTLSLSYWIKSSGGSTSSGINTIVSFSDANDGSTDLFMYFRNSQSKHLIVQNRNNSNSTFSFNTNFVIADGNWHHVGFTADSSGHKIYIDGNQITPTYTTGSVSTLITMPNDLTQFNIGGNQDSGGNQWFANATIDQVRVYSSALSSADITALSKETNVPTANLDAHYKLDGNGQDATGNYNATSISVSSYTSPAQHLSGYNGTDTNITYTQDTPSGNINVGFAPDLVWFKGRDIADHHALLDSVRGDDKPLYSNLTGGEGNWGGASNTVDFDNDGFSLKRNKSEVNSDNKKYVAWCWKAGGAASLNENGSIDSQVSVNQDAGFSIVTWTGNGLDATVGTGLSSQAELVITKGRANLATYNQWTTYHKDLSTNHHLYLNTTDSEQNGAGDYFRDAAFTDSVIGLGNDIYGVNVNNTTMVAYCFHSVDGFSKIGSYTGNGSSDSPFVYTGFKPAWIMIKNINNSTDTHWGIFDNARDTNNPNTGRVLANLSNTESTTDSNWSFNFYSNGFKPTVSSRQANYNGDTYIYMAFAEDPVKYSNGVATLGDGNEFIQDANYPEDNFAATTYTGNGSTQKITTGVDADLVWIKARDTANSNGLYDSVRGAGNLLVSDLPARNNFYSTVLNSFDSNGFTIGTSSIVNTNSDDYVAWSWKAAGHEYKSAKFNGSTSYIESGISTNILNSDYTISFWGKSSNISGSQTFINTNNNAVAFVRIDYSANGNLYFFHRNSSSTSYVDTSIASGMADGNWHHIVITKDDTSVKAYKDGSLVGTITSTSGTYSNNTTLQIGRNNYNTNGANNFDGNIDQVRIFNKEISPTEVATLYNETKATVDTLQVLGDASCIATYRLNGDALDLSGNYNGTESNIDYVKGGHFTYNVYENKARTFSHKASDLSLNTGTIAPGSMNVNRDNGFSIVKYTGSGNAGTSVSHGLSKPPEIVIIKNLDTDSTNWVVKHFEKMSNSKNYLYLNEDDAIQTAGSTTFVEGHDVNNFTLGSSSQTNSSDNYIAYAWHSVPGFSKIGSYTGKGNAGMSVYLGFEPAWILIRRVDSGNYWSIFDNKRDQDGTLNLILYPNVFDLESNGGSTTSVTVDSDGFSFNSAQYGGSINTNGGEYIYMAFAHR